MQVRLNTLLAYIFLLCVSMALWRLTALCYGAFRISMITDYTLHLSCALLLPALGRYRLSVFGAYPLWFCDLGVLIGHFAFHYDPGISLWYLNLVRTCLCIGLISLVVNVRHLFRSSMHVPPHVALLAIVSQASVSLVALEIAALRLGLLD